MLFPLWSTLLQIQAERTEPFEMTATVGTGADINILNEAETVVGFTPVLDYEAEVSRNGTAGSMPLRAVQSDYLHLNFTEGTIFPDSSNMPYLVLNQAAAKLLRQDGDGGDMPAGADVTLTVNGVSLRGNVCGIFADDSESPTAYMSYALARERFKASGETMLLLRMTGGIVEEKTASQFRRAGLDVDVDETKTMGWEYKNRQLWQELTLCLCVLGCAALLMRSRRRENRDGETGQMRMLQMAGMTGKETKILSVLQILFAAGSCLVCAGVLALAFGQFSVAGAGCGFLTVLLLVPMLSQRRERNPA